MKQGANLWRAEADRNGRRREDHQNINIPRLPKEITIGATHLAATEKGSRERAYVYKFRDSTSWCFS